MFDRLFDFVAEFLDWFKLGVVITEYEKGVVLTFGRFRGRILEPGFHWKWPLGVDDVLTDNVVMTTTNLGQQTLTTLDGHQIILGAIVRWKIRDIVKITTKVEDSDGVLIDVTYGVIAKIVRHSLWADISTDVFIDAVYSEVRKRAFNWGVEVEEIQITDLAKAKVIRLVGGTS